MRNSILLFFCGDFPDGNSKNARIKTIALSLKEWGYKPRLASVFPSQYSQDRHDYSRESTWNDIPFLYLSGDSRYYKNKVFRLLQIMYGQFMSYVYAGLNFNKMKYAYFYCPRLIDTLPLMLFLKLLGKTIIVDQTELFSTQSMKRLHRWEERMIAKYADVLLLISHKLKTHFDTLNKDVNSFLFPVMVDFRRFEGKNQEAKPYLLGYLGSFDEKDGVINIIMAVKQLIQELPELQLKLMGFNQHQSEYSDLIEREGLENYVISTGRMSYESIPKELMECDTLIINRSTSEFSSYGYPIKLAEYFAAERTVLISDIEGYAMDFSHGDQVYKFRADSVDDLADAIKQRYVFMSEADAVAQRGRQYAENYFDAERNSMLLKNILQQL